MSGYGHNRGPSLEPFKILPIDSDSHLENQILHYLESVSSGVFEVIIPRTIIMQEGIVRFQVKEDGYVFADYTDGKLNVLGIEECVSAETYRNIA